MTTDVMVVTQGYKGTEKFLSPSDTVAMVKSEYDTLLIHLGQCCVNKSIVPPVI
jgi:hypothetical protein